MTKRSHTLVFTLVIATTHAVSFHRPSPGTNGTGCIGGTEAAYTIIQGDALWDRGRRSGPVPWRSSRSFITEPV
jgi:hypothetical protein